MENEDLQERPAAADAPPVGEPGADAAAAPLVVPEAAPDDAAAEAGDGELIVAAAMASEAAEEELADAVADEAVAEALDGAADDALAEAVVAHAAAEAAIGDAAEDLALADALHEAAAEEADAGDVEAAAADEALAEELEVVAAESVGEAAASEEIAEEALTVAIEDRAEADALHEAAAGTAADALVEGAVAEELIEAAADVEAEAEAAPVIADEPQATPDAEAETETKPDDSMTRGPGDWYVVHTYSGYENKVKTNLHQRIASMQMEDKIFDVVIPMEDVMEIKGGKKQVVQRKVFPGYLLVRMIYDNDSWYVVRNTPGVTGFVSSGTGTKPTPLSKREVEKILSVPKADERKKPEYRLEWEEGDVVRIIAGPFADFTGTISEINVEQSKLRVMVNIFDRETPVELAFDQVAKA